MCGYSKTSRFEVRQKGTDCGCGPVRSDWNAERGLIDADLGGGVIKQRIARPGKGKSGGFRTIILFQAGARAFFVHGFAKKDQGNIRDDELSAFKMLAAELLAYDDDTLGKAIAAGVFMEVMSDDKAIS
jgi:hypothetical protein